MLPALQPHSAVGDVKSHFSFWGHDRQRPSCELPQRQRLWQSGWAHGWWSRDMGSNPARCNAFLSFICLSFPISQFCVLEQFPWGGATLPIFYKKMVGWTPWDDRDLSQQRRTCYKLCSCWVNANISRKEEKASCILRDLNPSPFQMEPNTQPLQPPTANMLVSKASLIICDCNNSID